MPGYLTYSKAKQLIYRLPIKSKKDWEKMKSGEHPKVKEIPKGIPAHPEKYYAQDGWKSWSDFLSLNLRKKRQND